jgi:copper(I)-binding protein
MMRVVTCLAVLLCCPILAFAQEIEVRDPWIRQPPPGANAAAYLTLANPGEISRRVTAVKAEGVERIEMHRTVVEEGVARMEAVDSIEIPAGGEVTLAPRGLHLMLIRPSSLSEGDEVELVFELDGDEYIAARAGVRREAEAEAEADTQHGHH